MLAADARKSHARRREKREFADMWQAKRADIQIRIPALLQVHTEELKEKYGKQTARGKRMKDKVSMDALMNSFGWAFHAENESI